MKWSCLLLFNLFASHTAWAAACCGGSFASPSTIMTDDKAQLTSTLSSSEVIADVRTDGLWRKRTSDESLKTIRIEAAHIFYDRWQAGFALPLVQRERASQKSSGAGDASASLGYEFLPDWDYHPWRPKGVGYIQVVAPTGRSIYDSKNFYGLDSRGRGFWSLGLGAIFTKNFRNLDFFANGDLHYSFSRSISNEPLDATVIPAWGHAGTLGGGYNISDFRFGTAFTLVNEDPVRLRGQQNSNGASQRYASAQLVLSYMLDEHWSSSLSYADQTVIGNPTNAGLSKTFSFQMQRRWSR